MSKTITVQVPDDVVEYWETPNELAATLSTLSVVELVRKGILSQGKAAELLNLSRWELMDLLARYDVPTANFSIDELNRQILDASQDNHA